MSSNDTAFPVDEKLSQYHYQDTAQSMDEKIAGYALM